MSTEDKTTDSMPLPFALKLDDWKFMVRGLLQLNANEHSVTNNEVVELTKMPMSKVSGNLAYLRLLGIITPESKGSQIALSEDGSNFAHSLVMKDAKTEKELLTKLVKNGLKDVIAFCELHKHSNDLTFDLLFDHIKYLSKVRDAANEVRNVFQVYRVAIYTIIEMLIIAEILDESFLPAKNKPDSPRPSGAPAQKKTFDIPTNCQRDWIEKLFKGIKDVNPPQVNKTFVTTSVVGNNHEGSVMRLARFLGISDDEDNRGQNYEKLRYYGTDDFRTNLSQAIREKYSKVLSFANLETVKRDNLVAGFMKEYDMDGMHAEKAMEILINLCEFAGIRLSDDLVGKPSSTKQESKSTSVITPKKDSKTLPSEKIITSTPISDVAHAPQESLLQVKMNINTDGKDWQPFENTLKFLKNLKQLDNINIEVNMAEKPVENQS
jgi:hypothetical protein